MSYLVHVGGGCSGFDRFRGEKELMISSGGEPSFIYVSHRPPTPQSRLQSTGGRRSACRYLRKKRVRTHHGSPILLFPSVLLLVRCAGIAFPPPRRFLLMVRRGRRARRRRGGARDCCWGLMFAHPFPFHFRFSSFHWTANLVHVAYTSLLLWLVAAPACSCLRSAAEAR